MLRVKDDVGGYVLAGGRSSRMGTDKALLRLNGMPLLAHVAEVVRDAVGNVAIVGDAGRHGDLGATVIPDEIAGAGPLGGIQAALKNSVKDWNLIVACDMPGINATTLRELVRIRALYPAADVLLPVAGGREQPLCALYRRRLRPALESAMRDGNLQVMGALDGARIARIDFPDDRFFRNVNTPEDWLPYRELHQDLPS